VESGENYGSRHTLTSRIDDFHKTHFIVHYKLFSIRILYCRVVCLIQGQVSEQGGVSGGRGDGPLVKVGEKGRTRAMSSILVERRGVNYRQ